MKSGRTKNVATIKAELVKERMKAAVDTNVVRAVGRDDPVQALVQQGWTGNVQKIVIESLRRYSETSAKILGLVLQLKAEQVSTLLARVATRLGP